MNQIMRLIEKRDSTLEELMLVTNTSPLELEKNILALIKTGKIKARWKQNNEKPNKLVIQKFYTLSDNQNESIYDKLLGFDIKNCVIGERKCC